MDLRVEKTRSSIINAFIELRGKKPLEKITVKELAELARINKATFYSHYEDIYDLSKQLEDETINSIINHISNLDMLVEDPKRITTELTTAFLSEITLVNILFSDSRNAILSSCLEKKFKEIIFKNHPEYNTTEWNIKLTAIIQGSFYAFAGNYKDMDVNLLIDIIGDINESILKE